MEACSRTSIGSSPNATSSGKVTCTTVSSSLMIRKSFSRRDVRKSWMTDKIVGFGFVVIFSRRPMWRRRRQTRLIKRRRLLSIIQVRGLSPIRWRRNGRRLQNFRRSTSLLTFMFDLGISWPSPFMRLWWRGVKWCFRSPPPSFPRTCQLSLWILLRMQGFTLHRDIGPDFWLEARDILSGDRKCQAAEDWSLVILTIKKPVYGFYAGSH